LKDAGCTTCAYRTGYSRAIPFVFLGCDTTERPTYGVAARKIKTYKKVTILLLVSKRKDGFFIDRIVVPDLNAIKDPKKRAKVENAVNAFVGRQARMSGETSSVDAVTGATRYQKRLYTYFNLMARKVAAEMQSNPDWARTSLLEDGVHAANH